MKIDWDAGPNAALSSAKITESAAALAKKPGKIAEKIGDVDKALKSAAKKVEAVYEVPFQAQAPMEPLSCTVEMSKDACAIWAATQCDRSTPRIGWRFPRRHGDERADSIPDRRHRSNVIRMPTLGTRSARAEPGR